MFSFVFLSVSKGNHALQELREAWIIWSLQYVWNLGYVQPRPATLHNWESLPRRPSTFSDDAITTGNHDEYWTIMVHPFPRMLSRHRVILKEKKIDKIQNVPRKNYSFKSSGKKPVFPHFSANFLGASRKDEFRNKIYWKNSPKSWFFSNNIFWNLSTTEKICGRRVKKKRFFSELLKLSGKDSIKQCLKLTKQSRLFSLVTFPSIIYNGIP